MCGIAGAVEPSGNVVPKLLKMLEREWNRGHTSYGIETYDIDGVFHVRKGMRLPRDEDVKDLQGECGIAHLRYSTRGSDEPDFLKRNAQPYAIGFFDYKGRCHPQRLDFESSSDIRVASLKMKSFVTMAHNGDIFDTGERRDALYECDVKYLAWKMAGALAKDCDGELSHETIVKAAKKVVPKMKGSFSFVGYTVGTDGFSTLFAGRDPWGIKPGFIGETEKGWLVASENAALDQVHCKPDAYFEMEPGHIYVMNGDGNLLKEKIKVRSPALCAFEYVYVADSDSTFMGTNVAVTKRALGNRHGLEDRDNDNVPEADIVVPVIDSGRSQAGGYSEVTKIPAVEAFSKNRARIDRTFILQKQSQREEELDEKLIPIRAMLANRSVILVDDSLIRGTTMKNLVKRVREEGGAKEVHVRIPCPPIIYPCYLGIDMKSRGGFIAARAAKELGYDIYNGFQNPDEMYPSDESIADITDKVCEKIDADSLGYLSMNGFINTLGTDRCMGCWNAALNPADLRDDIIETIKYYPDGYRV